MAITGLVTGDILVEAIANKLSYLFPEFTIYKDDVPQNSEPNCFFISQTLSSDSKVALGVTFRRYEFHIQFFPKSTYLEPHIILDDVSNALLNGLKVVSVPTYIKTGAVIKPIKANELTVQKLDKTLSIRVVYTLQITPVIDEWPLMNQLTFNEITYPVKPPFETSEFITATVLEGNALQLDDTNEFIDGSRVERSIQSKNTILWQGIKPSDKVVVMKSELKNNDGLNKYFILEALNEDRVIKKLDGGEI